MLRIHSNVRSICTLESYLDSIFKSENLPLEKFGDILVSLTEAVSNAIIHGNEHDEDKIVIIAYKYADHQLTFYIKDEGQGFNPDSIPDPTCIERLEECGGRGVRIMNELSDHFCYKTKGKILELGFNIT